MTEYIPLLFEAPAMLYAEWVSQPVQKQIAQAGIIIFGLPSVHMVLNGGPVARKWGPVVGLCGQPFWLYAGLFDKQIGGTIVNLAFLYVWYIGFKREWIEPWLVGYRARRLHKVKDQYWATRREGYNPPPDCPRPPPPPTPRSPFPRDSWQHAVDDQLVGYGKTSQEFSTPHAAVNWLVRTTGDAALACHGVVLTTAGRQLHSTQQQHIAHQYSDQMVCSCGVAWDVNDPATPAHNPVEPSLHGYLKQCGARDCVICDAIARGAQQ